jgi:hypothetical protein
MLMVYWQKIKARFFCGRKKSITVLSHPGERLADYRVGFTNMLPEAALFLLAPHFTSNLPHICLSLLKTIV